jgi:hypothetical protein
MVWAYATPGNPGEEIADEEWIAKVSGQSLLNTAAICRTDSVGPQSSANFSIFWRV